MKQWLARPAGGAGGRVLSQASRLAGLSQALDAALPANLAGHWQLAQVHPGALVLVTESPAWATQLRFAHNTLLETVERQIGFRPRTVQVRSTGYRPQPRKRAPVARTMSAETAALLDWSAGATDDARLREALQRLARAGRDKTPR